jgi:DNA-binding NtrC family response regulator
VLERALLTMNGNELRGDDIRLEEVVTGQSNANGFPMNEWEIRPLDDMVSDYVRAAVEAAGGNIRKAARQLKISPSTLYARLKSEGTEKQ